MQIIAQKNYTRKCASRDRMQYVTSLLSWFVITFNWHRAMQCVWRRAEDWRHIIGSVQPPPPAREVPTVSWRGVALARGSKRDEC